MPKIDANPEKIEQLLTRGVTEIIDRENLRTALLSAKKPLRIKLGIDPTSPDLHLGHSVVLRKLREFQRLGHQAILIIGDFTAQIGDPSGRSKTRPSLTPSQIKENMKDYLEQASKVIDIKKTLVRYNSRWLKRMSFVKIYELSFLINAAEILQREDFRKRLEKHESIRVHELFYPMMQALDSIELEADVEIGGNDQLFNNLMGRSLMERLKMKPQNVLTTALLEGTDGKDKMSKSLGNYIGLTDKPNDMFGKVMSVKDELIEKYFKLCTDLSEEEIKSLPTNPRDKKVRLAFEIVKLYHGEKEAKKAEAEFRNVFSEKNVPTDIPTIIVKEEQISLIDLMIQTNLIASKSEARRLIEQGGVKIDNEKIQDPSHIVLIDKDKTLQVGPRRFVKIKKT